MPYQVSLIDNNLLKLISRAENYQKYIKYHETLTEIGLVDRSTRLILTPAGMLEFLGINLPSVDIETSDLEAVANRLVSEEIMDFSQLNNLRVKLMDRYEKALVKSNCFSKQFLSRTIGITTNYISPELRPFLIDLIKGNLFPSDGRRLLYNRVALDRSLNYKWNNKSVENYIQASILSDLVHSYEMKIGYSSLRGLSRLWMDFSAMVDQRRRKGEGGSRWATY